MKALHILVCGTITIPVGIPSAMVAQERELHPFTMEFKRAMADSAIGAAFINDLAIEVTVRALSWKLDCVTLRDGDDNARTDTIIGFLERAFDRYGLTCGGPLTYSGDTDVATITLGTGVALSAPDYFVMLVAIERNCWLHDRHRLTRCWGIEPFFYVYPKTNLDASNTIVELILNTVRGSQ